MVEVKCDKPDIEGKEEDPTDDRVEHYLNDISSKLPKEEGTPISKTPVNVTLEGELLCQFDVYHLHSLLLAYEIRPATTVALDLFFQAPNSRLSPWSTFPAPTLPTTTRE